MTEHVVSVAPVEGRPLLSAPAYRFRCTCGAKGVERVAVGTMTGKVSAKARTEAREEAVRDAIGHQREAARRP